MRRSQPWKAAGGVEGTLGLALLYGALSALSLLAARAFTDVVQLGIAEAAITVLILRDARPRRRLPPLLFGLATVSTAVHLLLGAAWPTAFALGAGDLVEIGAAVTILHRLQDTPLRRWAWATLLLPVAVVAGVAAPAGAWIVALVDAARGVAPFAVAFQGWWLGHTLGALIAMPPLLAWFLQRAVGPIARGEVLVGQVALAALALVSVIASALFVEFPFIAISCVLLVVAVAGRLFTNALVCAVALSGMVLPPTLFSLTPPVVEVGLLFKELGLAERMLFSSLSVLPPLAIAAVGADLRRITARLAAERRRLHAIADNVPGLIAHLDNGLRYRFVNRCYEQWWGIAPSDILGRTPEQVLPPEVAQTAMPLLRKCLAGETQRAEIVVGRRTIQAVYVPARDVAGLNGVLVLATDVSEHKRLEQRLAEEKRLAEVTLSSIGDAVVTVDATLAVTYLNPVAERMLGCPLSAVIGRAVSEVVRLQTEPGVDAADSPLAMAVREGRVAGLSSSTTLVSADGTLFSIEDSAAPIFEDDGRVAGAVMVFHDVTESRALSQRMAHLAQHDALTGLPNRLLLQDRLERALADSRGRQLGALMLLDLDRFKHINDSLGHPVGDRVLQEVAHRFQRTVRAIDTVSRQGGDEFVVLLPQLRYARDAGRVADKLMRELEDPIEVEGRLLHVGVTIGIALFPADGSDVESVVRHADIALYQAKAEGRGRYRFYDACMSERAERRLHLENELRGALRLGQFELAFQPKLDARTGDVVSAEALLRWRRGERLETPDAFLQIAEDSGLMPEIESWALHRACEAAAAWQRDGLGKLTIAVNTALSLHEPEALDRRIRSALSRSGLAPGRLVLEVVERQLLFGVDGRAHVLESLAESGVRIAVDDFGTDYSNLRYLQRFPFHELKIDRSFVEHVDAGERGRAMVAAIIAIARALDIRVVAEGVETERQRDALVEMGCEQLQGYLFAPPMSDSRFRDLLSERRERRSH